MEVTPPPPRHIQYPVPLAHCAIKESRARTYTTVQTATDTADGVLTLYKWAKTSASKRAERQPNRKRKHRLKRFTRRRRFSSHKLQHRHTKKHTHCTINTQKQYGCRENMQNAKMSIKTSEKSLQKRKKRCTMYFASEREQRKQPLRASGRTKKRTKKHKKRGQKNVDIQKQKQRQNNST